MSASHETLQPANELDPALQGLPIETVGQDDPLHPDPNAVFPHVMHHGTKDPNFKLDDTLTHRTSPAYTGARAGRGLYTASRGVGETFGGAANVELIAKDAQLLDLEAPEASLPLSAEFRAAYAEDFKHNARARVGAQYGDIAPDVIDTIWNTLRANQGMVAHDQTKAVAKAYKPAQPTMDSFAQSQQIDRLAREIASQINTARIIIRDPSASIRGLFGSIDPANGPRQVPKDTQLTFEPIVDFLTSRGLDGAITAQRYKNGQTGVEERGVVLWKLDKVGDRETWERRNRRSRGVLGGAAVRGAAGGNVLTQPDDELRALKGAPVVEAPVAQHIDAIVKAKGDLAPPARMTKLAEALRDNDTVNPLKVIRNLANSSPELSALLSAGSPSGKGPKLHESMQAALGVFESRFAGRIQDPKERQLLRTALVLRNIGKSLAPVLDPADKAAQARINTDVARTLLRGIDDSVMSREDKIFVSALVNQNIIGDRMNGGADDATARQQYLTLRQKLPPRYHAMLQHGLTSMYTSGVVGLSSEARFTTAEGKTGTAPAFTDSRLVRAADGSLQLQPADRKTVAAIVA